MNLYISDEPQWVDFQTGAGFLLFVKNNPTWWLKLGIEFRYIAVRFDARTGCMLIKGGILNSNKYLNFGES